MSNKGMKIGFKSAATKVVKADESVKIESEEKGITESKNKKDKKNK